MVDVSHATRRAAIATGATPGPVLWVSSLLYLGVLCAGTYFHAAGLCAGDGPAHFGLFAGALVALLAVEQLGRWPAEASTARRRAVALLALRMLLCAVVAAVDCSSLAQTLYLLVPFMAYFCLGRRASYAMAAVYLAGLLAQLWLFVPAWHLNREALSDLLMFGVGLLFAISMAGVARDAEEHRSRAERLLGDLAESHRQLQRYAGQVAELAAAEERNRLARDIHDSLGHHLTAISIQLEKAITFRQRDPHEAEQALWDARRAARQALQDVRQSVSTLRCGEEPFVLAAALRELARRCGHGALAVELQISGEESGFPKLALMSLYRAAQEGLTNAQKHAQASRVTLRVALGEREAQLSVDDDGRGFDLGLLDGLPARRHDRFGLQGLRERLELVGGTMQVASAPSRGTQLRVTVPRQAHQPAAGGAQ